MSRIPLFDCVAHPTLDGNWLGRKSWGENRIDQYLEQMRQEDVRWAFCVGMHGIGAYDEDRYSPFILSHSDRLFPIAFYLFDPRDETEAGAREKLEAIRLKRYVGIKIHPRFASITLDLPGLRNVIKAANELGLAVFFCTYFEDASHLSHRNTLSGLAQLISETRDHKMILVHGGTVRLMELMEIVSPYPNLLMDLSLTLCKYEGSSIDLDLKYVFKNFDRRICVGSDSPEFSLGDLRRRYEFFAEGIAREKQENIAYRNLSRFTGMGAQGEA